MSPEGDGVIELFLRELPPGRAGGGVGQAVRFGLKLEAKQLVRLPLFTSSWVPAAENILVEVPTGRTPPPVLYFASHVVLVWEEPGLAHRSLHQWVYLSDLLLLLEVDGGSLGPLLAFPQDPFQV